VAGSLLELPALRSWGGIANALTLAVFIATMVVSVIRGGRPPARRRRNPVPGTPVRSAVKPSGNPAP
jgi:hypothetical protein